MNTSFGAFKIVNTYGAFGTITRTRHEVVLQGTVDTILSSQTKWLDYEFNCKPGSLDRRPCLISPYHYRMDWLMWFAAFQNYQQCPWLVVLINKLLKGSPEARALLAFDGDPFKRMEREMWLISHESGDHVKSEAVDGAGDGSAQHILPTYIRAQLYEYEFEYDNSTDTKKYKGWERGKWWRRRLVREYVPPIEADNASVKQFLSQYGLQ
jgi:hypothetical protein